MTIDKSYEKSQVDKNKTHSHKQTNLENKMKTIQMETG